METVKELSERYEISEYYVEGDTFPEVLHKAATAAFNDSFVIKYEITHERLLPSGAKSGMTEHIDVVHPSLRLPNVRGESLKSLKTLTTKEGRKKRLEKLARN